MNRRIVLYTLSALLFLGLMFGVVMPWGIGYTLHSNVIKRFKKLETHPQYKFSLKSYDKSIYHSRAVIEITSKSLYKDKPKMHLIIEEDIHHGPVILDFAQKKVMFKLAKMSSHVLPQDTDFIKFDQKDINLSSFVNYRWKEDFITQIDKISGTVFLADNKPCSLEMQNLEIKGDLGFSTLNLLQNVTLKQVTLSLSNDTHFKMQDVLIHNNLTAIETIIDHSEDKIESSSIEITFKKNKIIFQNPKMCLACHTEANKGLLELQAKFNFEKLLVNDKTYGPLQGHWAIHHMPKVFIQDIDQLEKIIASNKATDLREFFKKTMQQQNLEFVLQEFNLHVPGGILALKGNYTLIPQDSATTPFRGTGKLITQIPKHAVYQFLTPVQAEALIADGFLLESDDTFNGYFVLKDKATYINGSNPKDPLFSKLAAIFKQPLSKEQKLYLALMSEDNETIHTLVKEQVNLNLPVSEGKYPIHLAAYMGNTDAINLFLASGVPVDLVDGNGNTPLYWASRAGHLDIVKALLTAKATLNAKNSDGWTPLQEASENGHPEIVSLLLEQGAKINAQDNDGRTALFWAAKEGHGDIIKLLLDKGADPCVFNVRNLTPLDIAREYKRKAAVATLSQCAQCEKCSDKTPLP